MAACDLFLEFSRGQSLINASVERGFLFQVVTSLLFSTRVAFSLVPSYEGTMVQDSITDHIFDRPQFFFISSYRVMFDINGKVFSLSIG